MKTKKVILIGPEIKGDINNISFCMPCPGIT
jgi:hypothetical protein